MKLLIQTLLSLVLVTQICLAQWEVQSPLPTGNYLTDISFVDDNILVAVGALGTIIRSTDEGENWILIGSGTNNDLKGVFFANADTGYAVGGSGTILKTVDSGISWTQQPSGTDKNLSGLYFVDANNGWIVNTSWDYPDSTNIILHTTDGGTNWGQQTYNLICGAGLRNVFFSNENTGYAVGFYQSVFKTTDGGNNWIQQVSEYPNILNDIIFTDENKGFAVGGYEGILPSMNKMGVTGLGDAEIIYTVDGGTTWLTLMDTLNANLYRISFLDGNTGIAVGSTPNFQMGTTEYFGIILRTTNSGASWNVIESGPNQGMNSSYYEFCFTNGNNGVIVGNYGIILKTTNNGTTWMKKSKGNSGFDIYGLSFTDEYIGWAISTNYYLGSSILHTTDGGLNWMEQTSQMERMLVDIDFTDSDNGWLVGGDIWNCEGLVIYHTTNGGSDWLIQMSDPQGALLAVSFMDEYTGWTVGCDGNDNGKILKTTNAGDSWFDQAPPNMNKLFDVFFIDLLNGWAVGANGTIVHTTNGGINWINQASGLTQTLNGIYFVDLNNGWVVGMGGRVLQTTNAGLNWILQISGTGQNLNRVYFTDMENGWIVGNNGNILSTTNGGTDWILQESNTTKTLRDICFTDGVTGWIAGDGCTILHTTNGGLPVELTSFTAISNGKEVILNWSTATELNNLGFEIQRSTEGNEFFTVGFIKGCGTTSGQHTYTYSDTHLDNGKYYYRLKQVNYDGSYEYSDFIEVDFRAFSSYLLAQNYPNPFNPITSIGFSVPEKSNVKIIILNAIGEEVAVVLNEEKEAGYHQVQYNASNLPSGVYFYQLKAADFIETKKMLLLK